MFGRSMFKQLGRKIIQDSRRKQPARALTTVHENDDAFLRYEGGSLCERGDDIMYHGGGHDHGHDHDDGMTEDERYEKAMYQLKCVTMVGLVFVGAQGTGAYLAGSIAIATDCAHLASDLIAFVMSIVALALTRKGSSADYTFGWHRSEIIGSITSIVFLLTLTIWLLIEAMQRVFITYEINGKIMLITAVLSLIFNLLLINILHQGPGHDHDHDHGHAHEGGDVEFEGGHGHGHGHGGHGGGHGHSHGGGDGHGHAHGGDKGGHGHGHSHGGGHGHGHSHGEKKISGGGGHGHGHSHAMNESKKRVEAEKSENINVTAAYLHILGDLLLSVGVVVSSLIIYIWPTEDYPWSKYFDPACTLVFSVIICITCRKVLSNGIFILMEGAPEAIDTVEMLQDIKQVTNVITVHDFHCWSLSRGKYSMSAHVVCEGNAMTVLRECTKIVNEYGIDHCTLQMEDKSCEQQC